MTKREVKTGMVEQATIDLKTFKLENTEERRQRNKKQSDVFPKLAIDQLI